MIIESLTNKKVKEWMLLHTKKGRDKTKQFIVEEEHLIQEAISNQVLDVLLYVDDNNFKFDNAIKISRNVMNKLSKNVSDVNYLGICKQQVIEPTKLNRVVILDGIQDPGNMGTIIRTALAFGFDQIIMSNDCVDIYNEKCIRSTQGALFKMSFKKGDLVDEIKNLKLLGFKVIGTSLKESIDLESIDCSDKMAFVFGNEGNGVRDIVLNETDINCIIQIGEFESLNVGIAAGIILYKFRNL